jgi:hypothetical protein
MHRSTCFAIAALAGLAGCAVAPAGKGFVPGGDATFEGHVVSVDTAPWAYDGNAVVMVATPHHDTVGVQLPARWNLCKAPSVDAQSLKPGDRVRVVAGVDAADRVTVCGSPAHRLERIGG